MYIVLATFLLLGVQTPTNNNTSSLHEPAVWKTGNHLPEFIDALVITWCNTTSQDAVRNLRITRDELHTCRKAKGNQSKALQRCELDKVNLYSSCQEEKLALEANFSASEAELRAQVAYWKEISQSRISVAECNYQKQTAVSKSQLEKKKTSPDNLHATSDGSSCDDQLRLKQAELKSLDDSLASCRLQLAHADATLKTSPEQAVIKDLKEQIRRLYLILTACGALLFGMVPAVIFLQGPRNGKELNSDGETIPVLTPAEARDKLELAETGDISVRPLLTSLVVEGKRLFVLLAPFNLHRRRRFALFGGGGDYSWEAEAARATASRENGGLLILLYNHTGHAFSETSLSITPEEIAMQVVPRDSEFPAKGDVGILWRNSRDLYISNADGVLEAPSALWQQEWIQYLAR